MSSKPTNVHLFSVMSYAQKPSPSERRQRNSETIGKWDAIQKTEIAQITEILLGLNKLF